MYIQQIKVIKPWKKIRDKRGRKWSTVWQNHREKNLERERETPRYQITLNGVNKSWKL